MAMPVYIAGGGIVSAAGAGLAANWQALRRGRACFTWHEDRWQGLLPPEAEEEVSRMRHTKLFSKADRVTLLAAVATAQLLDILPPERSQLAVMAASARGATELLEQEHTRFLQYGTTSVTASPHTTAGMLAAHLSSFIASTGLSCTLSATCASGMHALGNALFYLRGGGSKQVLCVASEAPLTPFVMHMLRAARVLSDAPRTQNFPQRPLHQERDGLVLAEGAAALYLSCTAHPQAVRLAGYGAAHEQGVSLTGISDNGDGLALAITRALQDAQLRPSDIDLIIGHGAATRRGDAAELRGLEKVFAAHLPPLRFHKWCVGHTLGSSTLLSVVLACQQMQTGEHFALPYLPPAAHPALHATPPSPPQHVLVCGLGFGGNCAALVLAGDATNKIALPPRSCENKTHD